MGEISILCMSAYGRTWIYSIFNSFVVLFFDADRPPISRGPAPLTYSCIYFSSYSAPSLLAGLPVSFQSNCEQHDNVIIICLFFKKLYKYYLYTYFKYGTSKDICASCCSFLLPVGHQRH